MQPRRPSVIGVAERVAEEEVEEIGNRVGYQVNGATEIYVSWSHKQEIKMTSE
jgi:HrpA-like RNA helicase